MKSFRDRLMEDFDVKKTTGKDGKMHRVYTYVGDYASWNLNEEELTRYKRFFVGSGISILLLFAWKSFQNIPLNSSRFAGGATILSLIALMTLGMGIWQFAREKKEMYLRDCRQIKGLIISGSILYMLFQLFGIVMSVIFLISDGFSVLAVLVLIAGALTLFLAFVIFAAIVRLKYLEIPGKKSLEGKY
jgi:uncharacterized membrane protein YidH (DUF202 family)